MKRIISLALSLVLCISLCACSSLSLLNKISYNDDASEIYYNGRTYINSNNYSGKYQTDVTDTGWVEISWHPYGIFFILGAVTTFYGNDFANPELIADSRANDLYIREDIRLDHSAKVCISDCSELYSFTFSQIVTGEVIEFDVDHDATYTEVCNFFLTPPTSYEVGFHSRRGRGDGCTPR